MSKLHLSASQLKTGDSCKRLHWFQKVGCLSSSKSKAGAERGKKLHTKMEEYLKTQPINPEETILEFIERGEGVDKDLKHGLRSASFNPEIIALRNLAHTPNSGLHFLIEQEFLLNRVFLGFIDLVVIDLRGDKPCIEIRDHKFTASPRYIPTEEDARLDPQAIVYPKAIMEYFNLESISFVYDFYGTKYKWYKQVKINLTKDEIEDTWLDVVEKSKVLLDNYLVPNASLVTPNYLSCGRFGGCEFKDLCFGGNSK